MKKLLCALLLSAFVSQAFAVSDAERQIIDLLNSISVNTGTSGTVNATFSAVGAAHQANSQVTASNVAGTLIAARPTRRSCLIRNMDTSITVYLGAATVTSANGMQLKAGESVVVTAITLLQAIAASGSPVIAVFDEYD
jgi:hypothetical protein